MPKENFTYIKKEVANCFFIMITLLEITVAKHDIPWKLYFAEKSRMC